MKVTFFILLCYISVPGFCQNYTIGGYPGSSIYIGLCNELEIPPINGLAITKVEGPPNISIKEEKGKFHIRADRPSDQLWIKLFSGDVVLDSINIKSEWVSFKQFLKTESFGLITPGSYPKEVLNSVSSIVVKLNVPWIESPIIGFEILIFQNGEVLYHSAHRGGDLNDPAIKEAIAKLKPGDVIEMINIQARLPYDDGKRPSDMRIICK